MSQSTPPPCPEDLPALSPTLDLPPAPPPAAAAAPLPAASVLPDPDTLATSDNPPGRFLAPESLTAVDPVPAAIRCFRVLRPLKKGGLGEVFVALDSDLNREVALKEILDKHRNSHDALDRFLLEAEVTGRLEHPGIIPIYALGHYPDGRPYYAMRLIKGESFRDAIDRFHRDEKPGRDPGERSLAFRELLRRFTDVCNAVAYAHSKGVLHRDLKPDNAMLGPFGETLVIDWGLAKVLGRPTTETNTGGSVLQGSQLQHFGETGIAGSPGYMSPEQVEARHEELGPATDIYSLGAILYTLLAGQPSVLGKFEHVAGRIVSGDFPPPSRVKQSVPAALEAVCLKAMALKPADRYPSAKEVAAEVDHWLADEPVTAYREPLTVRVRRWGRRHRALVSSLAALLVTLTAALAVGLGLVNAEKGKTQKALERSQIAEKSAAEQRKLALKTMTDVVSQIDALKDQPNLKTLRKELLTRAKEGLEMVARAADTAGQIDHLTVLVHFQLGDILLTIDGATQKARDHYESAHQLAQQLAAADPVDATAQRDLSSSHERIGNVQLQQGDSKAALASYQEGLKISRKLAAEDPDNATAQRDLSVSHNKIGDARRQQGDSKAALASYQEGLKIRRNLAAQHDTATTQRDLSVSHDKIGDVQRQQGDLKGALASYGEGLKISQQLLADDPTSAAAQRNLSISHERIGNVEQQQGDLKGALTSYQKGLKIIQKLATSDPDNATAQRDLSVSYDRIGDVQQQQRNLRGALASYQDGLKISQKLAAADPSNATKQRDLSVSYNKIGDVQQEQRDNKAALASYQEGLKLRQQLAAADPSNAAAQRDLSVSYNTIGDVQQELGDDKAALASYQDGLKIRRKLAAADPSNATAQRDLLESFAKHGDVALQTGEFRQAADWFAKALDVPKRHDKPEFFAKDVRILEPRLTFCRDAAAVFDDLGVLSNVPDDRRPEVLAAVLSAHTRNKQPVQAVAAADLLARNAKLAESVYDAACGYALCVPLADKPETRERYAVRAVALLKQAVEKGYKDAAHIKMDTDLDAVRERDDFKALLKELEGN